MKPIMPPELPPEWWGDPKSAWAMLDSARQDDELRRLADEVAGLKKQLKENVEKDVNNAHKSIRSLTTEAASLREAVFEKKFKNLAFTIIVAVLTVILVMLAATLIPAHWAH